MIIYSEEEKKNHKISYSFTSKYKEIQVLWPFV